MSGKPSRQNLRRAGYASAPRGIGRRAQRRHPRREETTEQNSAAQNPQGDLFTAAPEAPEPEEHPLVSTLRDLQPDEMSPKEALEKMYQLKKLV
ncbi:MAG: hypothetical protein Q8L69_02835 [Gallionellaceae bacterium]|nr:hypothetical protein [Gallionellaceae bacterium]